MIDHGAIRYFGDIPRAQAKARPDEIALVGDIGQWTYRDLDRNVSGGLTALADLGVGEGQRVCWLGSNSLHWFVGFFASVGLRACFVPLNTRLSAGEIAFMLKDCGTKVLLVLESELDLARAAVAETDAQVQIVTVGFDAADLPRLNYETATPGDPLPQRGEDDMEQLYTSGTTGLPKGVRLINSNYEHFMQLSAGVDGFDYESHETLLIVMPLYHVAGSNVSLIGLAHGCRVVVETAFDPYRTLDIIRDMRAAQMFLAPTQINMLLEADKLKPGEFSSVRTVGYGSSPITEAVLRAAQARMQCQFTQFYGMTETAGSGTFLAPQDHRSDLLRSCGKAWPGLEAMVQRPDGTQAAVGEVGEIVLRGPTMTPGYWNRPDANEDLWRGGWLHTGDAGYVDDAGFHYMHDRIKNMIVSGGENVYPAEVENAISGLSGVVDVAVIGVPSDKWGEEVKAVIVRSDNALTAEDVITWTRQKIAGYKLPKSVDFVEALPRNPAGKILHRELRAQYWEGRDRAIG